jgi:3-hydroxybutyryl-CoA dehydrogenase
MGRGIAQVFAQRGWQVVLSDPVQAQLSSAMDAISRGLDREVGKARLAHDRKMAALGRIEAASELGRMASVDLVVEAVSESLQVKQAVFGQLNEICRAGAILASNTSSISIARLAAASGRPAETVGMHFMNPVPVMELVEVVRGPETSRETLSATHRIVEGLGKTPVEVNDAPGFVSNRVLMPMINEAVFCVHEGVGTAENVDAIMKLGMNHPMGPLALADLIGLDVCLDIMETLYDGFRDTKYRPCPLLESMVTAGHLGRKTGRGFYRYGRRVPEDS